VERDVDTTDPLQSATAYTELAAHTAQLDPQTAAEIERIHDTHGPMGYSAAMGIAIGMANAADTPADAEPDENGPPPKQDEN